jgi:hypothetical protein
MLKVRVIRHCEEHLFATKQSALAMPEIASQKTLAMTLTK